MAEHSPELVVVTGGPGAGKTAVLELARRAFCEHVVVLPEAASIVFGGGFPRLRTGPALRAAQRAIFHVQRQLEAWVEEERQAAVALCDRGTLDGLAYWPDSTAQFFGQVATSRADELSRYRIVLHLRTPTVAEGYIKNRLRIESAEEAARIDERIGTAWEGHPHYYQVPSEGDFTDKALGVLGRIRDALPQCCRDHSLPGEDAR